MVDEHLKFSIVTPVYNRKDCIKRCIDSVQKQSYSNWEHIVVDDGSDDGTDMILEKLAKEKAKGLLYFRQPQNGGPNSARNRALDMSSGDFVLFLDSADMLVPDALSQIVKVIDEHPDYLHFLFIAGDRIDYCAQNTTLKGHYFAEITFGDWLKGKLTGDFVHVVSAKIWDKARFIEKYRIYEALTFWDIYKLTQKQLFCNEVIIQVELNRSDAVSREANLYKKNAIQFSKEVMGLMLQNHYQDYIDNNAITNVLHLVNKLYFYTLMLGMYDELSSYEEKAVACGGRIKPVYKIARTLHCGKLLCMGVKCYSFSKHLLD